MRILKIEKDAAGALAEAKYLEAAAESEGGSCPWSGVEIPLIDKAQCTCEYVQQYTSNPDEHSPNVPIQAAPHDEPPATHHGMNNNSVKGEISEYNFRHLPISSPAACVHSLLAPLPPSAIIPDIRGNPQREQYDTYRVQEPYRHYSQPPKAQSHPTSMPIYYPANKSDSADLARYLLHREMVSSGLLQFDDQPENY